MHNENQRNLVCIDPNQYQVATITMSMRIEVTYPAHVQVLLLVICRVLEIKEEIFGEVQHRSADIASLSKGRIVSESQYSGQTDVGLERQERQRPEELRILVFRPCQSTGPAEPVDEDNVGLVSVVRGVNNAEAQLPSLISAPIWGGGLR